MHQRDFSDRFSESDAIAAETRAEQRALLIGALARAKSTDLRIFVVAVYDHTHTATGTGERWWSVKIRELCGLESGQGQVDQLREVMACSERQAKRITRQARDAGLVRARPAGRAAVRDGIQEVLQPGEWLEYQIDWPGIRRLIGLEKTAPDPQCQPVPSECQPVPRPLKEYTGTGTGPGIRNPIRTGTGTGAPLPRLLDGLTVATLSDVGELIGLWGTVCQVSPIRGLTSSEHDRLFFVSAACHTLRVVAQRKDTRSPILNPVAWFRKIVANVRRDQISGGDQDRAAKLIESWERERESKQVIREGETCLI